MRFNIFARKYMNISPITWPFDARKLQEIDSCVRGVPLFGAS